MQYNYSPNKLSLSSADQSPCVSPKQTQRNYKNLFSLVFHLQGTVHVLNGVVPIFKSGSLEEESRNMFSEYA